MAVCFCLCYCSLCVFVKNNTERKGVVKSFVYSRNAGIINFDHLSILPNDDVELTNSNLTGRLLMEKIWNEMYEAAKAVLNERRISEYVTCGEVSAAVLSKSGKIYAGVCIDTCSTLGICAERNAIFNMITSGEHEIDKVLCILPDGSCGAPCGACRELMVQLMAGRYYDIEIMLDYSTGRTVKLGEITPEWWIK